jgi:ribose 5-phosphate isomerase B
MRIVVACDHRGFDAKLKLLALLSGRDHHIEDLGCAGPQPPVDYPDLAVPAALKVASGHADIAILLDNSGIGMSIAANKIRGARAALAHDEITARIARAHNHCNILCMGCDLVSDDQMRNIVAIFLETSFEGGRHDRRVEKVNRIEP